jgi:hypothetical protein
MAPWQILALRPQCALGAIPAAYTLIDIPPTEHEESFYASKRTANPCRNPIMGMLSAAERGARGSRLQISQNTQGVVKGEDSQ